MAEICAVCGLPGELCICQEIAKEQQRAIISTDRRRYGKLVTKVEGIDDTAIDINKLAKELKAKCHDERNGQGAGHRTTRRTQEDSSIGPEEEWIQRGGEMNGG